MHLSDKYICKGILKCRYKQMWLIKLAQADSDRVIISVKFKHGQLEHRSQVNLFGSSSVSTVTFKYSDNEIIFVSLPLISNPLW